MRKVTELRATTQTNLSDEGLWVRPVIPAPETLLSKRLTELTGYEALNSELVVPKSYVNVVLTFLKKPGTFTRAGISQISQFVL